MIDLNQPNQKERSEHSGVFCTRCGSERLAFFNGSPAECGSLQCTDPCYDIVKEDSAAMMRALVEEVITPMHAYSQYYGVCIAWVEKAKKALSE